MVTNLNKIVCVFFSLWCFYAQAFDVPFYDSTNNKLLIDKVIIGDVAYRVELKYENGVLKVDSVVPYAGDIDLSQFQDIESTRRTTWNIKGFQDCVDYSKAACANELLVFQTPANVTAAGHCAVSVRCRDGGDKSAVVGSSTILWSYELVYNEMACINSDPKKLRGNILAVPVFKYWTCPSSNPAKQQYGFPGLTILKSYSSGVAQIRITHAKGYWSNINNLLQAFDFYLEFKSPDCSTFGRPIYMWYGHKDGVIWLDGDLIENQSNCGGVLVYVTNSKLPNYEATFFVDL